MEPSGPQYISQSAFCAVAYNRTRQYDMLTPPVYALWTFKRFPWFIPSSDIALALGICDRSALSWLVALVASPHSYDFQYTTLIALLPIMLLWWLMISFLPGSTISIISVFNPWNLHEQYHDQWASMDKLTCHKNLPSQHCHIDINDNLD